MLRRALLTLLSVAAFGGLAAIPVASAHTSKVAPHATCPPGSATSPYCERCVVPNVVGDSIRGAKQALQAADCRLGLIYLQLTAKRHKRVNIGTARFKLYTVLSQSPKAGATEVAGYRVKITVKFTG